MKTHPRSLGSIAMGIAFLTIVALSVSGCATISAPRSPADTVLVVPVQLDRSAAGNWDGRSPAKYVLKIKGVSDPSVQDDLTLDPSAVYSFRQGLPAGTYTIAEVDFVQSNGKLLNTWPLGADFELEPGRLTIPDLSCVYRIYNQVNMVYYRILADHLSVTVAQRTLGALTVDGTLSKWTLSEKTTSLAAINAAKGSAAVQKGPTTTRWAKTAIAAAGAFEFYAIAADSRGGIYAVGRIEGNEPCALGNSVTVRGANTNGNGSNIALVKYDANGAAQWARSVASGGAPSWFSAVTVDGSGNIYAAGVIQNVETLTFGNGVTARGSNSIGNGDNLLLVKYDASGTARWARSVPSGPAPSWIRSLAVDKAGNVYAAGVVVGSGSFSLGNGVAVTGTYAVGSNILVMKYNPDGEVQWARSTQAAANESWFNSVDVDDEGNVYAAGAFRGTGAFSFGGQAEAQGVYEAQNGYNALLVKYDASGTPQWARGADSGSNLSFFRSVAVDRSGSVFASGGIHGAGSFTFGTKAIATGSSTQGDNTLLVRYDPSGEAQWAKTTTVGSEPSWYTSVEVDTAGNIYAAGMIRGAGQFVFGNEAAVRGNCPGGENIVVVKYSSDGQARWAQSVSGGARSSWFNALTVDSRGDIYAAGGITGIVRFDFGNGATAAGAYEMKNGENPLLVKYGGQ